MAFFDKNQTSQKPYLKNFQNRNFSSTAKLYIGIKNYTKHQNSLRDTGTHYKQKFDHSDNHGHNI